MYTYTSRNQRIGLEEILHPCTINTSAIVKYKGLCFVDRTLSVFSICAEMTTPLIINFGSQSADLFFLGEAARAWTTP